MHATSSAAVLVLVLMYAVRPALAQDARACANEVQRLSEGLPLLHAEGREGETLAQEPGARKGASLPDERRQHIADLVRQAAAAGERGDGQGCVKGLGEARVLLREAGLGSSQPGPATYDSPAGAGSAAGEANLGGAGSASTPARSPSSDSAGSMGLQGAGSAGAARCGGVWPHLPGRARRSRRYHHGREHERRHGRCRRGCHWRQLGRRLPLRYHRHSLAKPCMGRARAGTGLPRTCSSPG
jgi:hypothetical protein